MARTIIELMAEAAVALKEKDIEAISLLRYDANSWVQPDYEKEGQVAMLDAMTHTIEELLEVDGVLNSTKNKETTTVLIKPEELESGIDLDGLEDEISDKISDATGFCHTGFTWCIQVEATLDKSE